MNNNNNENDLAYFDTLEKNLNTGINSLGYTAVYAMADWYENQAIKLRGRARSLVEKEHQQHKAAMKIELLKKVPSIVLKYIKQGYSADRACELTHEATNVSLETVKYRWKDFLTDKNRNIVRKRNAEILEMHTLGFSNVNISERLNLHAVTVSRILKTEKNKRYYRKGCLEINKTTKTQGLYGEKITPMASSQL